MKQLQRACKKYSQILRWSIFALPTRLHEWTVDAGGRFSTSFFPKQFKFKGKFWKNEPYLNFSTSIYSYFIRSLCSNGTSHREFLSVNNLTALTTNNARSILWTISEIIHNRIPLNLRIRLELMKKKTISEWDIFLLLVTPFDHRSGEIFCPLLETTIVAY